MIPVFGEAFLQFAALCGALQMMGLFGKSRSLVCAATVMAALLMTASFAALLHAFAVSDFSVLLVAANSHTAKPLLYKLSGTWGNHEGSILLFCWLLSLLNVLYLAVSLRHRQMGMLPVLGMQGAVLAGFAAFTAITSNPFVRLFPAPLEGQGLNPLLQDVGLALHPPMLYSGYVGFSLALSFAVAQLLKPGQEKAWAKHLQPWIRLSWAILTIGIGLGSWWAYRELGWGGFWFWDPVENASLLPWLSATALLHSLRVVVVRSAQIRWSVLLAILTFALGIAGFFLVRSGVLSSVHSFALDPGRGAGILLLLLLLVGGSLLLFALRGHLLKAAPAERDALFSRAGFLLLNNLLLMTLCFTVLLGTVYPLFVQAFGLGTLSVGAPYFDRTFNPIAGLMLALCAAGGGLSWKRAALKTSAVLPPLLALVPAFLLSKGIVSALCLWGASWLFISLLRAWPKTQGAWPMWLAHLGVALLALSIALHFSLRQEQEAWMTPQQKISFAGWQVGLNSVRAVEGPNYIARQAHFTLQREGRTRITALYPETRYFPAEGQKTTEAAIQGFWRGDIYVVIGDHDLTKDAYAVRLYFRPMMWSLWLGVLLMALGGFAAAVLPRKGARV